MCELKKGYISVVISRISMVVCCWFGCMCGSVGSLMLVLVCESVGLVNWNRNMVSIVISIGV